MDKPETSEDIIKRLAGLPCPTCVGCGRTVGCHTCDGSGVRFPWLRQECLGYSDDGRELVARWYPRVGIPLEEALAKLPVYERLQVLDHWRRPLWGADSTTAEDVRLAFWQAVEKAVSSILIKTLQDIVSYPTDCEVTHALQCAARDALEEYGKKGMNNE